LAADLRATQGLERVHSQQSLAPHTALRVGGPADLLIVAENIMMLRQAVTLAWEHDVPCRVLGRGSNVLVSDAGVRGLVVVNRARAVTFSSIGVRAESGASFSTLARRSVTQGLAGLEWAVGIPGTVGGAVVGNAGAWGGDVASMLVWATVMQSHEKVQKWPVERFAYGYRTSILKQQTADAQQQAVVLEAQFALRKGKREALESQVAQITSRRKGSQPQGATCGSVFKNPPGDYAGRLIEAAGLKDHRQGEAEISAVHANFFVNRGSATAADVKALIDLACETVQTRLGVGLELEIELVGEW
jgi:UDP-N-acetylmuramate dehydrogenase